MGGGHFINFTHYGVDHQIGGVGFDHIGGGRGADDVGLDHLALGGGRIGRVQVRDRRLKKVVSVV